VEVTVDGTPLAGSILEVHEIPPYWPAVTAVRHHDLGAGLPVPCGSTSTSVVSGQELLVTSLELCPV